MNDAAIETPELLEFDRAINDQALPTADDYAAQASGLVDVVDALPTATLLEDVFMSTMMMRDPEWPNAKEKAKALSKAWAPLADRGFNMLGAIENPWVKELILASSVTAITVGPDLARYYGAAANDER